jgi:CRISPR/Cas system-associated exonuclease Cas4 (RecB family)
MKGPTQSYCELMNKVLVDRAATQRAYHPLRPSSAGTCARRLANDLFAFEGKAPIIKEVRKPSVERLLSLGHFIEEQVAGELKGIPGMGVRFQQQVVDFFKLSNGHNIEGSTDFVMWSEETRGVVDAKTVGDRWHAAFASKWDAMMGGYSRMRTLTQFDDNAWWAEDTAAFLAELGTEDSLYKNVMQVNGYACTPFMQQRGVDHGSILRYNKNNSTLMEVRFKPSPELFEGIRKKFNTIVEAVAQDKPELVAKERVLGHVDCTYCPYKAACWPGAGKRDFYKGDNKRWATKVNELEMGAQLEAAFVSLETLEKASADLSKVEKEIILLIEGHGQQKVKRPSGEVWEVKQLAKSAELRRSKE